MRKSRTTVFLFVTFYTVFASPVWAGDGAKEGDEPSASSVGKSLEYVGGIGLGITYAATALAGITGPSTDYHWFLVPIVGPFIQSSYVSPPYNTLNMISGTLQAGFFTTLLIGVIVSASSGSPKKADSDASPTLLAYPGGGMLRWSF